MLRQADSRDLKVEDFLHQLRHAAGQPDPSSAFFTLLSRQPGYVEVAEAAWAAVQE